MLLEPNISTAVAFGKSFTVLKVFWEIKKTNKTIYHMNHHCFDFFAVQTETRSHTLAAVYDGGWVMLRAKAWHEKSQQQLS